jgi:putative hydrolase of HD superfamily
LRKIAADVNNAHVEEEIVALWLEYENSSSVEAVLAHQLDKLEMIIQANEYEVEQDINLDDFFESTKDCFRHPEVSCENSARYELVCVHGLIITC